MNYVKLLWSLAGQLQTISTKEFSSQSVTSTVKTKYTESIFQGHPASKLSQKPLKDISRLLVIYKDCLKRCFYQLEEFDLFGYLS